MPYAGYRPESGSSGMVITAAIAFLIVGALSTLFGLLLVAGAGEPDFVAGFAEGSGVTNTTGLPGLIAGIGAFFLVVGVLQLVAAAGLLAHKSWGRWLGIVLASLGLGFGGLDLLGSVEGYGSSDGLLFGLVIMAVYGFVIVALAVRGYHFRPKPWAAR